MTRVSLIIPLLVLIGFSASAQFDWLKKKKPVPVVAVRYPDIPEARCKTFDVLSGIQLSHPTLSPELNLPRTAYSYDIAESALMRSLYHTLRFHMYLESITSFHTLIGLYMEQNRYAEAKWFWLQCSNLAQQNSDQAEAITALIGIGMVKAELGEFDQAHDDLLQARNLSSALARYNDMVLIDKKLALLKTMQILNVKNESRYAEVADEKKTAQ